MHLQFDVMLHDHTMIHPVSTCVLVAQKGVAEGLEQGSHIVSSLVLQSAPWRSRTSSALKANLGSARARSCRIT